MKKIASLVMAVAAMAGMASAQNFTLEMEGTLVTEGATITVENVVDPANYIFDVKAYMLLTNTSSADLTFAATLEPQRTLGSEEYFTWCGFGLCQSTIEIEDHVVKAGEVVGADHEFDPFDLSYTPDEAYAPLTVACVFKDKTSGKDLSFTVNFIPRKPTANEQVERVAIAAYPNPAVDQVNFRLDNVKAGSRVLLRDLTGKTVQSATVNGQPEVSMSLRGLSSGMYFYCVEENGSNVAVGKLMIR